MASALQFNSLYLPTLIVFALVSCAVIVFHWVGVTAKYILYAIRTKLVAPGKGVTTAQPLALLALIKMVEGLRPCTDHH